MSIDTREELINALETACEVEHSLLVQYLYAGLSAKRGLDEGLTTHQQRLLRDWQSTIFRVAREEMGHLGIVCNLMAAIGAAPKMDRRPMPSEIGYFPFPFDLLPFSDDALHRFLVFELPQNAPMPPPPGANLRAAPEAMIAAAAAAPDPLEYEYVGELYSQISDAYRNIPEADLFIGPEEAQSGRDWSDPGLDMRTVRNSAEAISAIENIIEDGEGTPGNVENSHYDRFKDIRLEYFDEGRFDAARTVPINPATRERSDGTPVALIKNTESLALTELFNASYGVMLLLLQHYFSLAPRTEAEAIRRRELQRAAQRIMSVAVRPLAEEVTLSPLDDPGDPLRAGPSFEIYSDVSLSPYPAARWEILFERLDAVISTCAGFADRPRVIAIGDTLKIIRRDLTGVVPGGTN